MHAYPMPIGAGAGTGGYPGYGYGYPYYGFYGLVEDHPRRRGPPPADALRSISDGVNRPSLCRSDTSSSIFWKKRNFRQHPEPRRKNAGGAETSLSFNNTPQKPAPLRLRLELDGTLKVGRFPKGRVWIRHRSGWRSMSRTIHWTMRPSEGIIPEKQYGAGTVLLWDQGYWEPIGDRKQTIGEADLNSPYTGKAAGDLEPGTHGRPRRQGKRIGC